MAEPSAAGRIPPHSQEAEVAVLGAIMLDPKAINSVAHMLQPDFFYRADHQKIYTAFYSLFTSNKPIDVLSVKEQLKQMGAHDIASNVDLFVTLCEQVPSISNAEHYAKIVFEKYLLRALISACSESLVDAFEEKLEWKEILDKAQRKVFEIATKDQSTHPLFLREIINQVVDTLMNHPERLQGIKTGYTDFDDMTGGFHRGEFVVIGGRPSTGKTTFTLNLIDRMGVRAGQGVLFFSLEMSKDQIGQNLLCCHAKIDSTPIRQGKLDKVQWTRIREAASELYEAPIYIDDTSAMTCGDIRAKCRNMFSQHDIKLVIIDYLQLMSGDRRGRDVSRLNEITDISRGLKSLAKELNVPLIALSQLSRAAEGDSSARPKLSHLRESGAIEQDADLVMLLYRQDPNDAPPEEQNLTEIIVAKQRNGPTGTIKMAFRKDEMRFESWSPYTDNIVQPNIQDNDEFVG